MKHMQHSLSHDTFKASMALGTWADAAFFNVASAVDILDVKIHSPTD